MEVGVGVTAPILGKVSFSSWQSSSVNDSNSKVDQFHDNALLFAQLQFRLFWQKRLEVELDP